MKVLLLMAFVIGMLFVFYNVMIDNLLMLIMWGGFAIFYLLWFARLIVRDINQEGSGK